jgi:hypothetical protein
VNFIVIGAVPERYAIPLDGFREAASQWAPHAQVREDTGPDDVTDATILVERPDEPAFHILHSRSGRSVFTDGTPDQAAEVAAWVAENFPPDGVEVWLTDDAHTRHIVLTPGMTPADVVAAPWQPH